MKIIICLLGLLLSFSGLSQSWQDVGGGLTNSTHGLLEWNGKLVVLGSFNNSPCDRVGLWDGASWECLDGGVGIVARAGCVWQGKLVVVGDFWNNFQPCVGCNGVAVWDGVSWTALDQGFNNDVLTCTVFNGDLIIGGDFTEANGVPINRVARWNETTSTFESMGAVTDMDNDVRCMAEFEGELWVGGDFNNIGGQGPLDGLVKWDETNDIWLGGNSGVDLIGGVNETVRVLYVNPNDGNLYMGGEFPELWDGDAAAEDFDMSGVAMYDGSNWTPLGTGLNEYCRAIHEYNGDLIVGGYFTTADGVGCNKIAKWNTTSQTFSPMGLGFDATGIDEYVKAAWTWNGIFFAGGAYTQAEGNPMGYIAQWYEAPTTEPTAVINSSANNACEGGCIDFLDNSTNGPTSWTWTFPSSGTPTSSDQNPGSVCWATAGTYTVTLEACNGNGCNTTTMDVTINATPTLSVNSETICEGESVTLTATPSAGGGDYLWSPTSEITESIVVSPATTTSYTVNYSLGACGSPTETSTVTVQPAYNGSENVSTCDGETITYPDGSSETITGPTSHTSVLSSINGCDSTIITNVTVNPIYNESESMTVCENSTVTYPDGFSETITASTSHTSNLSSVDGCDSIIVSTVTMAPAYNLSESVDVCENDVHTYPDGSTETITASTSHTSNMTSINGCDSTIVTTVNMNAAYDLSESYDACENSTYVYPDGFSETITSNTSHTSIFNTITGCDSTIVTNITMVTAYNEAENISVCENTTVTYPDGSTELITSSTSHTSALTSASGCDSNVVTNVTMNSNYNLTVNENVCQNETYIYPDGSSEVITGSTSQTSSLTSTFGCDSTIITNITMNEVYSLTEEVTVCDGENYIYPDGSTETITANASHTSSLSSVSGCDSIVQTNVTMAVATNETIELDVCSGSTYVYPDGTSSTNITVNESHTSVLNSINGCDSTIVTNLMVNTVLNYTDDVEICSGDDFTYPDGTTNTNITVNESYVSTLTSQYGCDSIITTNVTVNEIPSVTSNDETICEGESATLSGTPSIGGGTYMWSPTNETTQDITVSPGTTTNYMVTYTLNGCSSVAVTSVVTVNPQPDVTTTTASNVITAAQNTASYQWLDCDDGNAAINGETNQDYAPTSNGTYAVEVELNGCVDTSECVAITTISIDEILFKELEFYPNPVVDAIYFANSDIIQNGKYLIYDELGKIILKGDMLETMQIDVTKLSKGIYIIDFEQAHLKRLRFVKQ